MPKNIAIFSDGTSRLLTAAAGAIKPKLRFVSSDLEANH